LFIAELRIFLKERSREHPSVCCWSAIC